MEFNRNHYFMIGVILVLLGLQFRYVQSVVLSEKAAQFLQQQLGNGPSVASAGPISSAMFPSTPPVTRSVQPPKWLGWSLLSIGGVLILHSFGLKKPGT